MTYVHIEDHMFTANISTTAGHKEVFSPDSLSLAARERKLHSTKFPVVCKTKLNLVTEI